MRSHRTDTAAIRRLYIAVARALSPTKERRFACSFLRLRRVIDAIIKARAESLPLFLSLPLRRFNRATSGYIAAARAIFCTTIQLVRSRLSALTPPGLKYALFRKKRALTAIKRDLIYSSILTPSPRMPAA